MKLVLIALVTPLAAQEPIRLATQARLWLQVPHDQPPLENIEVSVGSATPAQWEKDKAVRVRKTDILFPIHWWSWSELVIRFTPAKDGSVELVLNGPWEREIKGIMPRQEILWDEISAEGADLKNGGFEEITGGHPASWNSPWGPHAAMEAWPLTNAEAMQGKHVAASWCKRPLSQKLQLKAGQAVLLHLHAKAATPADFIAPKRLGNDTPAHRALAGLKRGVNLGNGWETPPNASWRARFTTEDIDRIAAEGFDHIRIPVAWHDFFKPKDQGDGIDPALLAELEPVLHRALEKKLHVILDWHHFNNFTSDPAANLNRFVSGWETIARHFKSWPPELFLELLNEPHDALTTEVAGPIYQKTIAAIRRVDPDRILVVSPGQWGQIGELEKLRLPDSDDRIVVTVHCYEPFYFTHQGAGWVGFQALRGVVYPGPPESPLAIPDSLKDNEGIRSFVNGYNTLPASLNPCSSRKIGQALDAAREWSRYFGRPVYLGEFGAHDIGDTASRGRYLHDVKTLAETRNIPWTVWEWKSNFGYWDPKKDRPIFHHALME